MNFMKTIFAAGISLCLALFASQILCGCGKENSEKPMVSKTHLELTSEPVGAEIFVNGSSVGTTPKKFSVKSGTYLLRFVKGGYEPQFMPLEIITGNASKQISVPLQKAKASALLVSKPSQAQVIVDGKVFGETPFVLADVNPGKHAVQIRKSGYAVRTVEFETKDSRPVKVFVNLQSNVGKLVIRSTPSRAKVFINGTEVGTTPYQGNWSEGTMEYRLQLPGYSDVSGKETVSRGKTVVVEQTLSQLLASLKVNSTPTGATVWIGTTNYGKTPLTIKDLTPNKEYTVVLRMPGCGDEVRKVSVASGGTGSILGHLSSDKGGINIFAGPAGLPVYFDGKKVGVLKSIEGEADNAIGRLDIRGLMPGVHKITISHPRGIPPKIEAEVTVVKNTIENVDIGRIWVPNAVIYFNDGQFAVGYIYGEDKDSGSYWFEDAKYHGIRGRIPMKNVREVKRLPLTE